jgi:hypothetical protein
MKRSVAPKQVFLRTSHPLRITCGSSNTFRRSWIYLTRSELPVSINLHISDVQVLSQLCRFLTTAPTVSEVRTGPDPKSIYGPKFRQACQCWRCSIQVSARPAPPDFDTPWSRATGMRVTGNYVHKRKWISAIASSRPTDENEWAPGGGVPRPVPTRKA